MKLSTLLKNSEVNMMGFPARQYVQLGSGLSLQVNSIEPAQPGWVLLKLQRFYKKQQVTHYTELLVQEDGSFLPNAQDICVNDVIAVTTLDNVSEVTPKGKLHSYLSVDLSEIKKANPQIVRIRNRANHWYTVKDIFEDTRQGMYMIQMEQTIGEGDYKIKSFHQNGREYLPNGHVNKLFSMYDIIEVQYQ